MRLGQLAREIGFRPKEILEYLHANGITHITHSNSKLDEVVEVQIIQHFNPEYLEKITASEETHEEDLDLDEPSNSTLEPIVEEIVKTEVEDTSSNTSVDTPLEEKTEVEAVTQPNEINEESHQELSKESEEKK